MDFLWGYYQQGLATATSTSERALTHVENIEDRMFRMERSIDQLKLVNVAITEMLVHRLGVAESEIINKIKEVDLRDGIQDGKFSSGVPLCPRCHRRYNSKLHKCQYCGYVDPNTQTIFDKITP